MFAHYSFAFDFLRRKEKIVGNQRDSADVTDMRDFKSSSLEHGSQTFFVVKPVMRELGIEMFFKFEEQHVKVFDPIMHRGGEDEITPDFQHPVNLIEKDVSVSDVLDYLACPNCIEHPIRVWDFFLAISDDEINARHSAAGIVREFRQNFDAMRLVSKALQFRTKGPALAANIQDRLLWPQAVDKSQGALEA
jgi:hypothetical protein